MARRRYSDVNRGQILADMQQNRRAWQDRPLDQRGSRLGQGQNRQMNTMYLEPFGITLASNTKYEVKVPVRSRGISELTAAIGNRVLDTIPETTIGLVQSNFRPARVIYFKGTGTSTVATSAITRARYLKRAGSSYTHPFGAATSTERELAALNAIRSDLKAQPNAGVSYQPERVFFYQ
jgi:hypothetical protein